jgi:hypothetical protein
VRIFAYNRRVIEKMAIIHFHVQEKSGVLRNPRAADALVSFKANAIGNAMKFYAKEELFERASRVEDKARRERNVQAPDLMRALAALYCEMAEELDDKGLFESRFPPLHFADLPDCWDEIPSWVKVHVADSLCRAVILLPARG